MLGSICSKGQHVPVEAHGKPHQALAVSPWKHGNPPWPCETLNKRLVVVEKLVVKVNVVPVPEVDEVDTLLEIVLEIVDMLDVIVEDVTTALDVVLEVIDDKLLELVLEVVDDEVLELVLEVVDDELLEVVLEVVDDELLEVVLVEDELELEVLVLKTTFPIPSPSHAWIGLQECPQCLSGVERIVMNLHAQQKV